MIYGKKRAYQKSRCFPKPKREKHKRQAKIKGSHIFSIRIQKEKNKSRLNSLPVLKNFAVYLYYNKQMIPIIPGKNTVKKIYPFLGTISVFLIFYFFIRSISEETFRSVILKTGPFAPVVFILLMLVTQIIAPLSGSPILFAGYYVFGIHIIFLTFIASFISSITNFLISRFFGRKIVLKLVGSTNIQKVDAFSKNYGFMTLFLLRVFQGALHDFISYAAGLTAMRFLPYLFVSTLGMIPGTILWYVIGQQVDNAIAFTIASIIQGTIFSALFVLGFGIVKMLKKKTR